MFGDSFKVEDKDELDRLTDLLNDALNMGESWDVAEASLLNAQEVIRNIKIEVENARKALEKTGDYNLAGVKQVQMTLERIRRML